MMARLICLKIISPKLLKLFTTNKQIQRLPDIDAVRWLWCIWPGQSQILATYLDAYLGYIVKLNAYLGFLAYQIVYLGILADLDAYLGFLSDLDAYLGFLADLDSYLGFLADLDSYLGS